jgi:phage tail sheath protein FI
VSDIQGAASLFSDAELFDINLLLAHELDINFMSNIAESRKDCFAIVAPYDHRPLVGRPLSDATQHLCEVFGTQTVFTNKEFTTFGTYSGIFGNMKYQYDKYNDVNRWIAIAGDIAGLAAQTDNDRDTWWAFAGLNRGKIKNVIKLAFNPNKQNRDDLYVNSINSIITIVGEGTGILMGQKTATAKASGIDRINVRRLLITIEKALATAVKYSLFEFNDSFTRNRLIGLIDPFMRNVKARRGVYWYGLKCDKDNNTPFIIDSNGLVIDLAVQPTKTIEFINLNVFINKTGDISFGETVG